MSNVKGATRKPTALLKLTGSIDKNPARHAGRKSEPKPTKPLGTAPKHFDTELKKIWREITAQCAPDVLFGSDRIIIEMTCILIRRLRTGTIKALEQGTLLTCLQNIGMTPIARSRITVPTKPKTDKSWAALLIPVSPAPPPFIEAVTTPDP